MLESIERYRHVIFLYVLLLELLKNPFLCYGISRLQR